MTNKFLTFSATQMLNTVSQELATGPCP